MSVLTRALGLAWRLARRNPPQAFAEEMSDPVGGGLWTAAGGVQQVDSRASCWSPALHVPPMCPGPLPVAQGHKAPPGQWTASGSDLGGGCRACAHPSGSLGP